MSRSLMTRRSGSPWGRSILTTSAPQSASTATADGTKPCSENSSTLIPASGCVIGSRRYRCERHPKAFAPLSIGWLGAWIEGDPMATKTMKPTDHYTIISADTHAGGSHSQYREYLDKAYLDDFDAWRNKYKNPFKDLRDTSERVRNWDSERRWNDEGHDGGVG